MSSRYPLFDVLLLCLAAGSVVAVLLLPPTPYLMSDLSPWALGLGLSWTLWRLVLADCSHRRWHAWRVSPTLVTTPDQLQTPSGLYLGQAFRWDGTHVQTLELALRADGALPVARGPRGGYPALQAVGHRTEAPLILPWEMLTRHLGIVGTTGSGKSMALQVLITQVIGE